MIYKEKYTVFQRSGLATCSDLRSEEYKEIFSTLEREQNEFLSKESTFRSKEYKWPRDPLHAWSRVWEYPYAYYHLSCWREEIVCSEHPKVADIGSGVTFFPFSIARLGCDVICTDIDTICESDLGRAASIVQSKPGSVTFRLAKGLELPFDNEEVDAVYSISVIEHIPNFEKTIEEIWRILKPNGLFVLTCDMCLAGDGELTIESYQILMDVLNRYFYMLLPERGVHISDILSSDNPQVVQENPPADHSPRLISLAWKHKKEILENPITSMRKGLNKVIPISMNPITRLAVVVALLQKK